MSLAQNPTFLEALKGVENSTALSKKRGYYKQVLSEWRWFPSPSPEGGTPTLAFGHKLTEQEWTSKRVEFIDPSTNEVTSKDFRYGITDAEADNLLRGDVSRKEAQAERDWNHYQGTNTTTGVLDPDKAYVSLRDAYKMVLVDKEFNSYLVKDGKWVWNFLAKAILAKDDVGVVKNSVVSWKDTNGNKHMNTPRAIAICKAAGLPWESLS